MLNSGRTSYATSATSDIKREQGLNYFIKYVLCLDTTMLRKFENENRNQNKKNLRLKIYGKVRNGRLKLEQSVLIKKSCITLFDVISALQLSKEFLLLCSYFHILKLTSLFF